MQHDAHWFIYLFSVLCFGWLGFWSGYAFSDSVNKARFPIFIVFFPLSAALLIGSIINLVSLLIHAVKV